ncbi:hypothetical protein N752_16515 [Desulforamulus aquiferis]|nr:hypothetical protein N752_16515 [Desulforamulus aquiferis]
MYETTLDLINRLDIDDLLAAILKRACSLLGTEHGLLYLINDQKDELSLHLGTGYIKTILGLP